MNGQFGVLIGEAMRPVPMNGRTPAAVLGLPEVNSYVLRNNMTLHCGPVQASPVMNGVNGPAVVVLLQCSDLEHSEIPLVQGPALVTARGGMTAEKTKYLTQAILATGHQE